MCEGSNDSGSVKNEMQGEDADSDAEEMVLGRDGRPIPVKVKQAMLPKRVQ